MDTAGSEEFQRTETQGFTIASAKHAHLMSLWLMADALNLHFLLVDESLFYSMTVGLSVLISRSIF